MARKNFETAMKRLEEIVEQLENGDLSLEDSIKVYEEGVTLMSFCRSKLQDTEKKIQLLQKQGDTFQLTPLQSDNGE